MMIVGARFVLRRRVTRGTDGAAARAQRTAVRIVAVAARDAMCVHTALEERTPLVDLAALLAVDVIQRSRQQRRPIVIVERVSRHVSFRDLPTPRVALSTH